MEGVGGVGGEEGVAGLDLAAGAQHDGPAARTFFVEEQAGDGGAGGLLQFELGGDDAGVVDDEEVGREEVLREVVEVAVLDMAGGAVVDEEA